MLQFGSEPLFDWVLTPNQLATQILAAKKNLSSLGIPVTISELAYGYQEHDNAPMVMDAIDLVDIHMLPFFAQDASTCACTLSRSFSGAWTDVTCVADRAWPIVQRDLNWFIAHGQGKKMYFSQVCLSPFFSLDSYSFVYQNGWPSTTYPGVEPNSPDAVADIPNEQGYYALLDAHCQDFKTAPNGGVGWFWHIYSDNQEPGYGLYTTRGQLKFPFAPKTHC